MNSFIQELFRRTTILKNMADRTGEDLHETKHEVCKANCDNVMQQEKIDENEKNIIDLMKWKADINPLTSQLDTLPQDIYNMQDSIKNLQDVVVSLNTKINSLQDILIPPTLDDKLVYTVAVVDNNNYKETKLSSSPATAPNKVNNAVTPEGYRYSRYSIHINIPNAPEDVDYEVKSDQKWFVGGKMNKGDIIIPLFTNTTDQARTVTFYIYYTAGDVHYKSTDFQLTQAAADKAVDRTGIEELDNTSTEPNIYTTLPKDSISFTTADRAEGQPTDNVIIITDLPIKDGQIHVTLKPDLDGHIITNYHSIAPLWTDVPGKFKKSCDIVIKDYQISLENIDA